MLLLSCAAMAECQTPAENLISAQDKVDRAQSNLKAAKQALSVAYPAYREDAKIQIKANDMTISDLRANFVKPRNSASNADSKKKIDALEDRNVMLRARLYVTEE